MADPFGLKPQTVQIALHASFAPRWRYTLGGQHRDWICFYCQMWAARQSGLIDSRAPLVVPMRGRA